MRLSIRHTTRYSFDSPVVHALQRLRLTPKETQGQEILEWEMDYGNAYPELTYEDQHHNTVTLISVEEGTQEVTVTCRGKVDTHDHAGVIGRHAGHLPLWSFLGQTDRTRPGPGLRKLAEELRASDESRLDTLHRLSGAILDRVAYKTGTSYGHRDAWALGFDGTHVAGVWMGRPDGTPVPGAFGGEVAAPILFETFALLKSRLDRLPAPPPSTLIVGHAGLPDPLKHFRPRDAAFADDPDAPTVAFPPDGAILETSDHLLTVKVRDGAPPFTWLADGRPVLTRSHDRNAVIELPGPGFVTLSVIDAKGRAARTTVQLD
mgnify:CR=1 FL=1